MKSNFFNKLHNLLFGDKKNYVEIGVAENGDIKTLSSVTTYDKNSPNYHSVFCYRITKPELFNNAGYLRISLDYENQIDYEEWHKTVVPMQFLREWHKFMPEDFDRMEKEDLQKFMECFRAMIPISEEEYKMKNEK